MNFKLRILKEHFPQTEEVNDPANQDLSKRSQKFKKEDPEDDIFGDLILGESNVGRKLSDLTTKRVILLVLISMVCIPLFQISTYFE